MVTATAQKPTVTARRDTCPSATLSTTNPTWSTLSANPSLRADRPATNGLHHGTGPNDFWLW